MDRGLYPHLGLRIFNHTDNSQYLMDNCKHKKMRVHGNLPNRSMPFTVRCKSCQTWWETEYNRIKKEIGKRYELTPSCDSRIKGV